MRADVDHRCRKHPQTSPQRTQNQQPTDHYPEVFFIFPRDTEGARVYLAWLRDVLVDALERDDEGVDSAYKLVANVGTALRQRLETDATLRDAFLPRLWPRFVDLAASCSVGEIEAYLADEHLWDLLAREDGTTLLKRSGPLAISLLLGDPVRGVSPYPEKLRETVAKVLADGDLSTITALDQFRGDPQFHHLLEREIPPGTLAAASDKLLAAGPDYPELLHHYQRLADRALIEDAGPAPTGPVTWLPGYAIYSATHKSVRRAFRFRLGAFLRRSRSAAVSGPRGGITKRQRQSGQIPDRTDAQGLYGGCRPRAIRKRRA